MVVVSSSVFAYFGVRTPQQQVKEKITEQIASSSPEAKEAIEEQNSKLTEFMNVWDQIPFAKIAFVFVFVSIRIVPADKRLSVHRLGQYIGDRGPGIVILIPFIDRGVMKEAVTLEESPFSD